jgi:hypothetical protein
MGVSRRLFACFATSYPGQVYAGICLVADIIPAQNAYRLASVESNTKTIPFKPGPAVDQKTETRLEIEALAR